MGRVLDREVMTAAQYILLPGKKLVDGVIDPRIKWFEPEKRKRWAKEFEEASGELADEDTKKAALEASRFMVDAHSTLFENEKSSRTTLESVKGTAGEKKGETTGQKKGETTGEIGS